MVKLSFAKLDSLNRVTVVLHLNIACNSAAKSGNHRITALKRWKRSKRHLVQSLEESLTNVHPTSVLKSARKESPPPTEVVNSTVKQLLPQGSYSWSAITAEEISPCTYSSSSGLNTKGFKPVLVWLRVDLLKSMDIIYFGLLLSMGLLRVELEWDTTHTHLPIYPVQRIWGLILSL